MKLIKWALINGLFFLILYAGLIWNIRTALNIGLFLVWGSAIISLLALSAPILKALKNKENVLTVPYIIDALFDVSVIVLLVFSGYIISGIAYTVQAIGVYILHKNLEKINV